MVATVPLIQVDAFTARPFAGNPAAVCLLERPAEEGWMLSVAREMNLSETAFVVPAEDGEGFGLRWFTPAREVELCGHATLAAAHALWDCGGLDRERPAVFHTRSGRLEARRREGEIEMDFPAVPVVSADPPPEVLQALRDAPILSCAVGEEAAVGERNVIVEMADEAAVRAFVPDLEPLRPATAPGLIVTAAGREVDFVSRYFVPSVGVDEDPVTGSIHCALGPMWARRLGKEEVLARQVSARSGELRVRPRGDRVLLSGAAFTVLVGELRVGPA